MIVRDSLQGLWACHDCEEWGGRTVYIEVAGDVVSFAVDVEHLEGYHTVPHAALVELNDQRIWWGTTRKSGFPSIKLDVSNFFGEVHTWKVGLKGESQWKHEWRCEAAIYGGGTYILEPLPGTIEALGGRLLQCHTLCTSGKLLGDWMIPGSQPPGDESFNFTQISIGDDGVRVLGAEGWEDAASHSREGCSLCFRVGRRRFRMTCSRGATHRYAYVATAAGGGSVSSKTSGRGMDGGSPPQSPASRTSAVPENLRAALFELHMERKLSFASGPPIPAPPKAVANLNPRVHHLKGLGGMLVKKSGRTPRADAAEDDEPNTTRSHAGMEHIFGKPKPPPAPEPPLTGRARKMRLKEQGFSVTAAPVRIPDIYKPTNTALGVLNAYKGPQKRAYKMTRSELPRVHRIMKTTRQK